MEGHGDSYWPRSRFPDEQVPDALFSHPRWAWSALEQRKRRCRVWPVLSGGRRRRLCGPRAPPQEKRAGRSRGLAPSRQTWGPAPPTARSALHHRPRVLASSVALCWEARGLERCGHWKDVSAPRKSPGASRSACRGLLASANH